MGEELNSSGLIASHALDLDPSLGPCDPHANSQVLVQHSGTDTGSSDPY